MNQYTDIEGSYPFVKSDGGRSTSARPKQSNDCTVRALAIATDTPYDKVYEALASSGRKASKGFHIADWLRAEVKAFGYRFLWIPFQAVKGKPRMNPAQFAKEYKHGRYIVKTAKHVFVFIDGFAYDIEPERANRCIYGCWKVEKPS